MNYYHFLSIRLTQLQAAFSYSQNLKKDIRGCHFRSDQEVVTAVEEYVNGKDPDFL